MTGQHARRSPTMARVLTAAVAFVILGLGAWAGLALRQPGADLAAPPGSGVTSTPGPAATTSTTLTASPGTNGQTTPQPPSAPVDGGVLAYEEQVVALANAERATAGCPALTVDTRLTTAARAHSTDMAARGYFNHTTPEGVTFDARINGAGYSWSYVAENIAVGQPDPAAVMAAWMDSDGHRRNIINCELRHIGVGLAYDGRNRPHWTQDFGTPG